MSKDNGSNNNDIAKDNSQDASGASGTKKTITKKKRRITFWTALALAFEAFIAFWAITTVIIPLTQSSGAEKYTGEFRTLAEGIYEFESDYTETGGTEFNELYMIHIENIYLTTDQERAEYCTDPERMTTDPARTMSYTVAYSRQILGLPKEMHSIVGCSNGYPTMQIFK